MTLEELTSAPPEVLERMSDVELLKHFQQYLCVTRPELAERKVEKATIQPIYQSPGKKRALEMLAAEGVDMTFLSRRKK